MENILGILGGMGPMATDLFYKMLIENTPASCDQEHINTIILGHATMPDRTGAILSGKDEEIKDVYEKMLADAKFLEKSGCKAIAVTCNTAHYFVNMIEKDVNIPFIHMIRETAKEAAAQFPGGKIGILATDGTVQTGLYQDALKAEGAEPYVLTAENQKLVMHEIYDCVKSGKPADMDAWAKIEAELFEAGCKAALLACTELPIIKENEHLSDFYIDPMKIMALKAIEFMGRKA